MRMLLGKARLLAKQLFLGRGAREDAQKGMTGNTVILSQPAAKYEDVMPNVEGMASHLVVFFCQDTNDLEMFIHQQHVAGSGRVA